MPTDEAASQGAGLCRGQLPVRLPLQELEELDSRRMGAGEFRNQRIARPSEAIRPLLPGLTVEFLAQHLEQRVAAQRFAMLGSEMLEIASVAPLPLCLVRVRSRHRPSPGRRA